MHQPAEDDERFLLLSPLDNVVVARHNVAAGESVVTEAGPVVLAAMIPRGHKIARRAIAVGEKVVKYGAPIGLATQPIQPGQHVHLHNVKSAYTASHVIGTAPQEPHA
jgi:hypothetical protein